MLSQSALNVTEDAPAQKYFGLNPTPFNPQVRTGTL